VVVVVVVIVYAGLCFSARCDMFVFSTQRALRVQTGREDNQAMRYLNARLFDLMWL